MVDAVPVCAVWLFSWLSPAAISLREVCAVSAVADSHDLRDDQEVLMERITAYCKRRAMLGRSGNAVRSFGMALSQNQLGRKQTIQNALTKEKRPISIINQMPSCRLMKASMA